MLITWLLSLCTLVCAQEVPEFMASDTTAITLQDSIEALLADPVLDSVIVEHGDSLLILDSGSSRIFRDQYGIPHIYGATDVDVAFGFGYAQAQDHLEQMLLSYRIAKGESAEILGEAYVESDFKSRLWRIGHSAGEQYGALPESTRDLIGGYVDGVNHYIDIHSQILPSWMRPIRGMDVVALSRWITFLFSEASGSSELAAKGMAPTLGSSFGSNQVVVGKERSLSSSPISASDLHLPWSNPFRLYEAHLKSMEGLDVSGGTFFGLPVIVVGHNRQITWSFTANDADVFDLYEEKLDPANPRRYVFEREKQRLSVRKERIKVRTNRGVQEIEREFQYSHHGPIYKVIDTWAYAASTTADDVSDVVGQLYQMNRASDLRSFRMALARLEIPVFNVAYTDVDGNVYYVFLSRTPIRATKFDWRNPVPGWTKETDWGGRLPFSQLPQIVNPEAGFLQNCNTPPDAVTTRSGLERSDFPAYLGWGSMNDRGRRMLTWLSSRPAVSVSDVAGIMRDEYLLSAEELTGFILSAYNRNWKELYDPRSYLAQAISVLRDWDRRASVDSRAVVLFSTWKARYDELHDQLSEDQRVDVTVLERLALEALQGTVAYMTSTFGRVDVRWGEVHQVERGELRFPVGGSPPNTEAIHDIWSLVRDDGTYQIFGGSAFTSVVEMSDPPVSWTVLPYGNSEDESSSHYADQAALKTENTLKRAWFTDEDVVANTTSILTLPFQDEALETERRRAWWSYRLKVNPEYFQAEADSTGETDGEKD